MNHDRILAVSIGVLSCVIGLMLVYAAFIADEILYSVLLLASSVLFVLYGACLLKFKSLNKVNTWFRGVEPPMLP